MYCMCVDMFERIAAEALKLNKRSKLVSLT